MCRQKGLSPTLDRDTLQRCNVLVFSFTFAQSANVFTCNFSGLVSVLIKVEVHGSNSAVNFNVSDPGGTVFGRTAFRFLSVHAYSPLSACCCFLHPATPSLK